MTPDTPNTGLATDLDTCSALFDGELRGDAARFALKRLGHDAHWRQACGRWQLLGDVLRGQTTAIAPGDFADRVAAAIAIEPVHAIDPALQAAMGSAVAAGSTPRRSTRPRWSAGWVGGAALAASVALVALFVARPFTPGTAPPVPLTQLAAVDPSVPANAGAGLTSVDPGRVEPIAPAPSADNAGLAVAAAAVAEVPRRVAERRSRGQSQRAALRVAQRRTETPVVAAASATAIAVNAPIASATTGNPFQPAQAEVATRPWPRAVLPNYPAASGALTAGFGSSTASSPSFYPFEPRMPADEGAAAAVPGGDGPRP
ncbi:RseA family anti-sigma factor [Lysobacter koreensis]|uniref:RseA family anti-sigma factor n=1 Tax=Lysobacter koreensis TaxID=266122 RepID=A0ABW2YJL5_9GAMM